MKRKLMSDASHEELENFVLITRIHLVDLSVSIAKRVQAVLQNSDLTQAQCYSILSHLEAVYIDCLKCTQSTFKEICWREEDNESLDNLENSIKASEQFRDEISKIDNMQARIGRIRSVIYEEEG